MIWLYAICNRPDLPAPRRRGLAQAPVEVLIEGGLMAVFTRHARTPGEPAPDALWTHERVVERLMADRAVLPLRFGSTLEDETVLRALLADNRQRFLELLARMAGRVEIGVRVLQPLAADAADQATPAVAATGRDYLLGKLRNGRRIERAAAELHAPLEAVSVEACRQAPRGEDEVLRSAYLVDQQVVGRFRSVIQRLELTHPDVAILCTGPWPPYSFMK
jgi:hypothetical protein